MDINLTEFEGYLKINKSKLDDDLIQQPSLLYKVGEAYTEAAAERDMLKEMLAGVDAELDGKIRHNFGDGKYTEAVVKSGVQAHKKHKESFDAYMNAKIVADKLGVLKDAMHSRGYMLRDLVQLHVANYFETTSSGDRQVYERQRARLSEARSRK